MRKRNAWPLLVMVLLTAAGCGADVDDAAADRTEAERQQALRESAFGGLVEPMDRAATVERVGIDRKRELDAVLDQ